jgi:hypothetical protein
MVPPKAASGMEPRPGRDFNQFTSGEAGARRRARFARRQLIITFALFNLVFWVLVLWALLG